MAKVSKAAFPDPTETSMVAVELKPGRVKKPVTLAADKG